METSRRYLYDGFGESDLVLLHALRLRPSLLLLVQQLTQLCGHLHLQGEEPDSFTCSSTIEHEELYRGHG